MHPKSKPELSCAKKETRTTKMKRRKNMLKLVFQDLGRPFLQVSPKLGDSEKTTLQTKTLKKLISIYLQGRNPKHEHEPNLTLSFERRNTRQLYHKICEENQKKSAEAKASI
jgi:hypothetical protein